MCSLKVFVLVAVVACVVSEPPRRRPNLRTFQRQEAATDDAASPPSSQGYNYEKPAGDRLRLPIKFREFSRQEETSSSSGYSYPKPVEGYGPPAEENPTQSPEYESPEEATDDNENATEVDDATTENPQSETLRSIQASQFRRKNAKITRQQGFKKPRAQLIQQEVQFAQQVQPVYYVQYPVSDLVEPQYVYVLK